MNNLKIEVAEAYEQARTERHQRPVGAASIGWGILGASTVAQQRLLPVLRQQPPPPAASQQTGAWAVSIYSHDEARAQHFAQQNQLPHADANLSDLLARPQIGCVYVASHPRHHFVLSLAALAAGKHVLCEAPLGLVGAEAEELTRFATARGLHLAVNHIQRAQPALQQLRNLLGQGAIGDLLGGRVSQTRLLPPRQQSWRLQPNGGGVILDQTTHSLDLLRFLLADEVAEVAAMSGQRLLGTRVEEDVLTQVRMARRGTLFHLHNSFIIPHNRTSVEIYGDTGTLIAYHCLPEEPAGELLLVRNQQQMALPVLSVDPYWHVVYIFQQAVQSNAPFITPLLASGQDGVRSLQLALAVQESVQKNQPVSLHT